MELIKLKKEKIIILQNIRYLESHLILKGLNPNGHVLSFIARFALKSRRRFAGGVLEPGGYIEVEYRPSSQGLHQINQAQIIKKFEKIRKDYDRLKLCLYVLKIVNQAGVVESQGDEELFNLLGNTLSALETTKNLNQLKLFFEIRFLFIQGVLPVELQRKSIFFENTILKHHTLNLSPADSISIQKILKESLNQYLH